MNPGLASGTGNEALNVTSEVGRLRQVLCHAPGLEIDRMIPDMMEALLFDDILHGPDARSEHAQLREVLITLGVEVLEVEDLLRDVLEDATALDWIKREVMGTAAERTLIDDRTDQTERLLRLLIRGDRNVSPHVVESMHELYELSPLPNICFQRDPQAVIGNSVAVACMGTNARSREALLAEALFRYHPHFSDVTRLTEPSSLKHSERNVTLEGGDVLVLSKDVVVVGQSQRTSRMGIGMLADALADKEDGPRWLVVVEVPAKRAFMHLDTLFTPVDANACLLYAPVIEKGGHLNAGVFLVDLHQKERNYLALPDLLSTLKRLGIDLEPIACGGDDPVAQQREQWTDGANAMALAPGVIITYNRNHATAAELQRRGFDLVEAHELLEGKRSLDLDIPTRTAILLPSNELSRARGGPHCLLQALKRDEPPTT